MASSARTTAVIALIAMLSPAIHQSATAATNFELAYLPLAKPSLSPYQPWINGDVRPAGWRPHHKRYSPPPPGNRWRNALLVPADRAPAAAGSALT